jgi:hypothetical protein
MSRSSRATSSNCLLICLLKASICLLEAQPMVTLKAAKLFSADLPVGQSIIVSIVNVELTNWNVVCPLAWM